jgi:hypothetical protein
MLAHAVPLWSMAVLKCSVSEEVAGEVAGRAAVERRSLSAMTALLVEAGLGLSGAAVSNVWVAAGSAPPVGVAVPESSGSLPEPLAAAVAAAPVPVVPGSAVAPAKCRRPNPIPGNRCVYCHEFHTREGS